MLFSKVCNKRCCVSETCQLIWPATCASGRCCNLTTCQVTQVQSYFIVYEICEIRIVFLKSLMQRMMQPSSFGNGKNNYHDDKTISEITIIECLYMFSCYRQDRHKMSTAAPYLWDQVTSIFEHCPILPIIYCIYIQ